MEQVTPSWAIKALKTKLFKDTGIACRDVLCGCPACNYDAKKRLGWWGLEAPSEEEAKHMKPIIENRLYLLENGASRTLKAGTAEIDEGAIPDKPPESGDTYADRNPDDPKFRL